MTPVATTVDSPIRVDPSGVARIGDTRVTLGQVVGAFQHGASAEEIALRFEVLDLGDIYATLAHYLRHRPALDALIAEEGSAAEAARLGFAEVMEIDQLRSRLLARG